MHLPLTSLLHFPLSVWHPVRPAPRRTAAAIPEEELMFHPPESESSPLPPPPDPYAEWRNPPRLVRALVTGFVCAMPGALLASHVGLVFGSLETFTLAGALIGFLFGTTLELAPDAPPAGPHSFPEETGSPDHER